MDDHKDENSPSASERKGSRPVTVAYHSAYCELREVFYRLVVWNFNFFELTRVFPNGLDERHSEYDLKKCGGVLGIWKTFLSPNGFVFRSYGALIS